MWGIKRAGIGLSLVDVSVGRRAGIKKKKKKQISVFVLDYTYFSI
jgi:hypothetical protein